jgi:PAS domain S-box-containing protein
MSATFDFSSVAWKDEDRIYLRGRHPDANGADIAALAVLPAAEHPPPASIDRLSHEFELRHALRDAWAAVPFDLRREGGRTLLLLEDRGGEPLDHSMGEPMELGRFLSLAIDIATALGEAHECGVVHKDIKPANVLIGCTDGKVRFTGFGIAARVFPRERQMPEPPEIIAGTLAYMAPEQTGRMNRSIDSRSDLYSLGILFYQMLTGDLPFAAADPMEWVHCHVARQPAPPAQRLTGIPVRVSGIVMKLLAKMAEDRYQTAAGLTRDLVRCRIQWEAEHRIDDFPLGEHDTPGRLVIPERLYGRDREIETLMAAFDRVVAGGAPELVLVSGYSGIGKSSLVNELHKVLVPSRGLFASGKFDQYKRDIPYATLVQAFQGLVRPLLGKQEEEIADWREKIQQALGANGQLILSLVPELELIVGPQAEVAPLGPQEEQIRFQTVFRRFLGVFACKEHPLALFLDDLQWLDSATLTFLEQFVTHPDTRYVLLIGVYRDNEVGLSHPLMLTLDSIRKSAARVHEIVLSPLTADDVCDLVADTLFCRPLQAAPLARLVFGKTGGNPFFVIQFIAALVEEHLLEFDARISAWRWELNRIREKGYTDNVVELMIGKLNRLPRATQEALKVLACLGHRADLPTLMLVQGAPGETLHADLSDAVGAGLALRAQGAYAFLHDRVREAAYALIPPEQRPELHLRIGRTLLGRRTPQELSESIFDVVNHLNAGGALLVERSEKERVAEINLRAARRAKASTAYASACKYLRAGMALLDPQCWTQRYELAFALWIERVECEYLTGDFMEAEQLIAELVPHCASNIDKAEAYRLKIDINVLQSKNPEAIDAALECLRLFGIEIPAHPTREEVDAEYAKVCARLGERPIESLIDLPLMTDGEMQAAMRVLSGLLAPAYFTDFNLVCLHLCHMVNLSLKYGTTDASSTAYVWFGVILGHVFDRYPDGYRFGKVACELVEKYDLLAYKSKTYFPMEMMTLWTQPVGPAIESIRKAFRAGVETGDRTIACYSCNHVVSDLLLRGDPLDDIWPETERGLEFVSKANYRDVADIIVSQQRFIENMRGHTSHFSTFDDDNFKESAFEAELTADRMATMVCFYWIIKLQARFISGDYEAALAAADQAQALLWSSYAHIQLLDFHYYAALALAAAHADAPANIRAERYDRLTAHLGQLREWAQKCSVTFHDKHALVAAEIARIDGRELEAERLYEDAIRLARNNGFVHNEGIANERAAAFYRARGFETIALAYLRNARYCYLRWGAAGKVRQLDELYPQLREGQRAPDARHTVGTSSEQLDMATVLKISQAVSGEIVLEKLIHTLLRTAVEHAGAQRGSLILMQGTEPQARAEAFTRGDAIAVELFDKPLHAAGLPESLIRYAARTQETVILDDASASSEFAQDAYIRRTHARSMLCQPLTKQGRVIALLYMENNLAPHAFTPARVALLGLLISEAATSLENSYLYRELQNREAKIRRLVDANIVGIFIYELEGRILEANDAFLRMVGYDREDLSAGKLRWTELTPQEWLERDFRLRVPELKSTGMVPPYEKEYRKKDGSLVAVMIGAATFEESTHRGVAFVLDLTETKRAEAAAGRMQLELAHANRVATMGQLTASIAHEVKQPIYAALANAEAAQNWLKGGNLEMAQEAIARNIKNCNRASEVINRIRGLVKKAPEHSDAVDLNEAIRDVIELTHGEAVKCGVLVRTALGARRPCVVGDRVQLQQVILNLMMNAFEAMNGAPGAHELLISTANDASCGMRVSIRDSGPGIPAEAFERLFDPFYTSKPGGLGMGLSICRSIVETHGGRLWADNAAAGGAVFKFVLPLSDDASITGADRATLKASGTSGDGASLPIRG